LVSSRSRTHGPEPLPRSVFARVYLRTLALQASWNPQRMQNLGLLVSLVPWIRRQHISRMERRRFCRRHYEYFNTNPYLANYVLGGLLRLETENQDRSEQACHHIKTYKSTLAQSFASLGDQLFWLGLKPTILLFICVLAMWGHLWWVLGVTALFGLTQLELRRRALAAGYRFGLDIVELLSRPIWHRAIGLAKRAGMSLTGVLAGCFLAQSMTSSAGPPSEVQWSALALTAALPFLTRHRFSGAEVFLLALPLALILAYV